MIDPDPGAQQTPQRDTRHAKTPLVVRLTIAHHALPFGPIEKVVLPALHPGVTRRGGVPTIDAHERDILRPSPVAREWCDRRRTLWPAYLVVRMPRQFGRLPTSSTAQTGERTADPISANTLV